MKPPNCLNCKEDCTMSGVDVVLFDPNDCIRGLFDDILFFEEEDEADWVR